VNNQLARHYAVPGRIQAEQFYTNNGLELESCSDTGGGYNTGYANVGDYLDYVVYVEQAGDYTLDFRIATERFNAKLEIQADTGDGFSNIHSINFIRTGGWQTWNTQSTNLTLEAGKYLLRLLVTGDEHNLNWFEFKQPVYREDLIGSDPFKLYPNPASAYTTVMVDAAASAPVRIEILDGTGRVVYSNQVHRDRLVVDTSQWPEGIYFVSFAKDGGPEVRKLIVNW
ncbi:MAG: carbohydrate-binding protein, partial [Bacteroidales bacterium]|nr:carbohydrate-binding protein [Bacteroidales bacterium]